MKNDYLPMGRDNMSIGGWKQCDFMCVSGDTYMDHPSFGTAIISRLLEARGYEVGATAQPGWKDKGSIEVLGRPRLGFLVSVGNMDSMVNHYSVSRRRRKEGSYIPGGVMGKRPDYAVTMYYNPVRSAYKGVPVIIGGVEANLRRLTHYDYWSNELKCSVLLDSQADLISYGMGERPAVETTDVPDSGLDVKDIIFIDGTVYKTKSLESVYDYKMLPDYGELLEDERGYARSSYIQYSNTDPFSGKCPVELYRNQLFVVQNPPSKPLRREETDVVYDLPYTRNYHPSYEEFGDVPAIRRIEFSLVSNRGCSDACSFYTLIFHQGRTIQARSHESLVGEAKLLIEGPDFKGYIHDVDGLTANLRFPAYEKQLANGACPGHQCLFPEPCKNLWADHSNYIALLGELKTLPEVKRVFIRSGVRLDYMLAGSNRRFLRELREFHASGQLKVAPEHVADKVLSRMGKPKNSIYHRFAKGYKEIDQRLGKEQYLVPYLISSHPGSPMKRAVELVEYLRDLGYMPGQIQDSYPISPTASTCVYYTGYDCRTMGRVYVPINPHEKTMQRALTQYRDSRSYDLVVEALKIAGRMNLIEYDRKRLIRLRDGYRGGGMVPATGKVKGTGYEATDQGSRGQGPKKTIRNIYKKKGT